MSMDLSLLVKANANQAKAEMASVQAEMKKIIDANRQATAETVKAATTETNARTAATEAARNEAAAVAAAARQKAAEEARAAAAAARAAQEEAAARAQVAASYSALRGMLDPLYAASVRYEQAVETLDAAVKSGAVSQDQANRVMAMAEDAYLKLGDRATHSAGGMSQMAYQGRMVAQQLGQVAQQGLVTGNYLGAMAIQFPDIAMGMATMGGAAEGATVAILGTEVAISTLIPVAALIASVTFPLMINAMGGGKSAADVLASAMTDAAGAVDAATSAAQGAAAPIEELAKKYGGAAAAVRDYLASIASAERLDAMDKIQAEIRAIADTVGLLYATNKGNPFGFVTGAGTALALTLQQAKDLQNAIYEAGHAQGFDAQVAAAAALHDKLLQIYGSVEAMPVEMRHLAEETATAAEQAARLDQATGGLGVTIEGAVAALATLFETGPGDTWLGSAISRADTLASKLWDAARAAAAANFGSSVPGLTGPAGMGKPVTEADIRQRSFDVTSPVKTTKTQGGGASSGNEVDTYIKGLQQELDLMRTLDPAQQEMIKNRDLLAKATTDQRAEIEQLVAAQQNEANLADTMKFFGDASYDALSSMILQGKSAAEVMKNLERAILQAALQALVLGEGPLAGIFGTKGTSLIGLVAGGIMGHAEGGMIYGAGGARDDKVLMAGSAGEFVVNGRATAANRGLLEFINGGGRFADGGAVGGGSQIVTGGVSAVPPVAIHIDARGAQMGVADQIAMTLRDMAPRFGQLAVEAVRNARQRGVAL